LLAVLVVGITSALYNKRWFLFSILLSLALTTHYITIFLVPSIILVTVVYNIHAKKVLVPSILSWLLPFVVFSLWFPILRGHWETKDTLMGWVQKADLTSFFNTTQEFLFGTGASELRVTLLFLAIGLVSLYAFIKATRKERLVLLYLLVMSLPPIFGVVFASIYLNINLYISRVLIGFLAVFLIYLVFAVSMLNKYVALSVLAVYLVLTLSTHEEVKNLGYRQLAEYATVSPRMLVMTDPMMYGTLKHYLNDTTMNKVRLQEGCIGDWPLIFPEDTVVKSELSEPFYLVNLDPIPDWTYSERVGEFYLYEWEPK